MFAILGFIIICEVLVLVANPVSLKEQMKETTSKTFNPTTTKGPLVVLYQGSHTKFPHASYSTGVWSSWGSDKKNLKDSYVTKTLPWAAEGAKVTKHCEVSCVVTESQGLLPYADVVLMEIINHPRTFSNNPVEWPKKPNGQLWGMFYYEAPSLHKSFLTPKITSKFDFTMTPYQDSTLPVTLICPWGKSKNSYLLPPPPKTASAPVVSYHHLQKDQFWDAFHRVVKVNSFSGAYKNSNDNDQYNLPDRLKKISAYKFAIIVESRIEKDWVSPEFSQALIAGVIPIYFGCPNINDFAPGEKSFINARDFSSGEELAKHVKFVSENAKEYKSYFDWKSKGLSPTFSEHFDNCAHLAECRVCKYALEQQKLQS